VAGSAQYTAGTAPVLVAAAAARMTAGPAGWFYLTNGTGATIYAGGPGVSSSNAPAVATSGSLSGYLFSGDQVYVVTDSGTSVVSVLQTGG